MLFIYMIFISKKFKRLPVGYEMKLPVSQLFQFAAITKKII
ncbi:hypothetical protein HMP0015_1120 [Acinetobacter haemolyticus ATCC 19194]|uniref:Uncharacterized protein n=1 Tax=Acinetobacter haemolyticus ATCC 19194 TaxID=707232 RepID=D4XN28_ACIHA|nr:hypothetical protein HMP0015_1120 [Acinetobacter haemolyticus ATCC 19194]